MFLAHVLSDFSNELCINNEEPGHEDENQAAPLSVFYLIAEFIGDTSGIEGSSLGLTLLVDDSCP